MPKPVSAFLSLDGKLFQERVDAEKHEIMQALVKKFGDKKAIELSVIVEERAFFENLFMEVKKDYRELPVAPVQAAA